MVYYDHFGNAYDSYGNMLPNKGIKVSKRGVINYLKSLLNSPEVDLVDDADSDYARHVCQSGSTVYLLPKQMIPFQTPQGVITVICYRCEVCGKLIIDNNFM